MFKTIHYCRLELVAHTVQVVRPRNVSDNGWGVLCSPSADMLPVSAARASFGREDKTGDDPEADLKLMKYLAKHQHLTPFEYNHATFLIECPLFIRSQIHRHRTFSYNEISRRYTSEDIEFWIPDKWRAQAERNKQASDGELPWPTIYHGEYGKDGSTLPYESSCEIALESYNALLSLGVCREQARAVLPQSLLTRFYMGGSLRNWIHFLKLRLDEYAQYEVRVVAERIEKELRNLWPEAVEALMEV